MSKEKPRGIHYWEPFARRLDALLNETGVTQTELAKASEGSDTDIKVTRQTISSYINGDTLPDIKRFKFIADFFEVSYDFLLGESDAKERENIDFVKKTGLLDNAISTLAAIKNEVDEDLFGLYYMKKILALLNYILYDIINLTDFIGPIISYFTDLKSYKLLMSILDSLEKTDKEILEKTDEDIELQKRIVLEMTDDEDVRSFLINSINDKYSTIKNVKYRMQKRFKFSVWRMSEDLIESVKEMAEILLAIPEVDESTGIGLEWYGELVTKNEKQSKEG